MRKPDRMRKKKIVRADMLARRTWVRFQGRHDPAGNKALEECELCDGDGCYRCRYVGLAIAEWHDIDDSLIRGIHTDSRVVQTANGYPAAGRFKGWDGRRGSLLLRVDGPYGKGFT